jgi:hypothetical protein
MMTGLIKAAAGMIEIKVTMPDIVRLSVYTSRELRRGGKH